MGIRFSIRRAAMAACAVILPTFGVAAHAQVTPYIGEVMFTGHDFCPENWLPADGRVWPVSQYSVLFALVGSTYGGDGVNSFGLPDLRGRNVRGTGTGPGLTTITRGDKDGSETVTLTSNQVPVDMDTKKKLKTGTTPKGVSGAGPTPNQPFSLAAPSLAVTACIAVAGEYPVQP